MGEESPQPPEVWLLAETDDWDTLARLGMARSQYATCDVVMRPEPNGWWDDEYVPYAVFTHRPELSYADAAAMVADAIRTGSVRLSTAARETRLKTSDTSGSYVDVSIDIDDLGSAIRAGMRHGRRYPSVTLTATHNGAPVLRFGSEASDQTDDEEDELNRMLDRL